MEMKKRLPPVQMPKSLRSTTITLLTMATAMATMTKCETGTSKTESSRARQRFGTWDPLAAINVSLLYFVFHRPTDRPNGPFLVEFFFFFVFMFGNFVSRPRFTRIRRCEKNRTNGREVGATAAATRIVGRAAI